jgi:hypothetical protein
MMPRRDGLTTAVADRWRCWLLMDSVAPVASARFASRFAARSARFCAAFSRRASLRAALLAPVPRCRSRHELRLSGVLWHW